MDRLRFNISPVQFPLINFRALRRKPVENYNLGMLGQAHIVDEATVQYVLGINVSDVDVNDHKQPLVQAEIRAVMEVQYEQPLDLDLTFASIPGSASIMGIMLPFVREKVHSCFASSNIQLMIPPQNFSEMITDVTAFTVADHRKKQANTND